MGRAVMLPPPSSSLRWAERSSSREWSVMQDVPLDQMDRFRAGLLDCVEGEGADLCARIDQTGKLSSTTSPPTVRKMRLISRRRASK